jgi:hypothetical protein
MLERPLPAMDESTVVPISDDTALINRSEIISADAVDPETLPAHEVDGATRILDATALRDAAGGAPEEDSAPEDTPTRRPATGAAGVSGQRTPISTSPASRVSPTANIERKGRQPVWARAMAAAAVAVVALALIVWLFRPSAEQEVTPVASTPPVSESTGASSSVGSASGTSPLTAPQARATGDMKRSAPEAMTPDMGRVTGGVLAGLKIPKAVLPPVRQKVVAPAPAYAPPGSQAPGAAKSPGPRPAKPAVTPASRRQAPATPRSGGEDIDREPARIKPAPSRTRPPKKSPKKPAKVDDLFDPF